MASNYDEEQVSKEVEEARPKESSGKRIAKSLSSKQIFFIALALFGMYYLAFVNKSITRQSGYAGIFFIIVVSIMLVIRSDVDEFATIDKAWLFLLNQLYDMQYKYNTLPRGGIKLTPLFGMEYIEGTPLVWQIRVDIKNPISEMEFVYVARLSPKPLRFMGLEYMPEGFDGELRYVTYKEKRAMQWARDMGLMPKSGKR